jgi:preprotein translocase SecF subunit
MFTAITVTRTFLHLLVNWEWAQNPGLYGLSTGKIASSGWDIVGKRNWFFGLSALLIVPGVVTLYMYHLRPGIEFTSGTTIQASFQQVVLGSDVRSAVNAVSPDSEVQLVEKGKTAYITTKMLSEQGDVFKYRLEAIRKSLDDKFHLATKDAAGQPVLDSVSSVGPTISRELTTNAIKAVVLASVFIVIYLTFRFAIGGLLTGLKYGTCAVIALIHDACFILGGFAILGHWLKWETDSLFVTAVLTIIGFSVHDTIVVFDRIRENMRHRQRGESFEQLANRSILQTLSRSINTSFTVVLTLATLVVFGGPLLRHFYITLMAGIIIGTYSSIFNATPLVIVWDKIGAGGKAPRRRVVEERPLVDKSPSNGGGGETDAIDGAVNDKPAQTVKSARPKRKKKRF